TAMAISRPILVKILPRCASVFSFLCLMVDHLLCPDINPPPDSFRLFILPQKRPFRQSARVRGCVKYCERRIWKCANPLPAACGLGREHFAYCNAGEDGL